MKKTILFSLLLAGAVSGFAQGTVNFANTVPFTTPATDSGNGKTDRLVYNTDNSTALSGTNWSVQLYYAVGSNQSESSLSLDSNAVDATPSKFFPTGVQLGKWQPQTKTFSNIDKGGTATLQVRVWNGALFNSFDNAKLNNGVTGKSVTFNYTVPSSATPALAEFYMEGFRSFTLTAAPEPSTIALGILGAASLFVVRRRKQ